MTDSPKSVVEAILFAARQPVPAEFLRGVLPPGCDPESLLAELSADYEGRGLHVARTRRGYAVRTRQEASDLAATLADPAPRLTRAAMETLACIAIYDAAGHPLTRSEIERVRGVSLSNGITDALLNMGYVRLGRRRDTPGRPLTWVVTDAFHDAYGLGSLEDLGSFESMRDEGLAELRPLAGIDDGTEEGPGGEGT